MTKNTTNLAKLLENDLEQAKLVIAAQDVLDRLQKIAEHLAELGAEEIMPLSDNMKAAFGQDVAQEFEQSADQAIQQALSTVRGARDVIDGAILKVQGLMPQTDMGSNDQGTPAAPETSNDMASQQIDTDANQEMQAGDDSILDGGDGGDGFDGSEASASQGEPMGRARKESVENKKALVESAYRTFGKKIIMNETLNSLVSWLLEDAAARLPADELKTFKDKVSIKLEQDPIALAGMIGFKKASVANLAQHTKPVLSPSAEEMGFKIESKWTPDERKARGIAKVIEANILAYGNGRAAQVVRQFTSTDLRENSETTLIETFKNIYGMSPSSYSVSLKKKMQEDITPTANPSPTEDTDPTSDPTAQDVKPDSNMTNMQKANAAKGVAKIAATIGTNSANGQKPLASVMSTLSGPEKQAVSDVVDNIDDQTGEEPDQVGELLSKASSVIGEESPIHPELSSAYTKMVNNASDDELKKMISYDDGKGRVPKELINLAKQKLSGE